MIGIILVLYNNDDCPDGCEVHGLMAMKAGKESEYFFLPVQMAHFTTIFQFDSPDK